MNPSLKSCVDMAFCINLDRRTDRWAQCSAQFEREGLQVHRFSAVDGSRLPSHLLPPHGNCNMTAGVYASLLSHLSVLRLAQSMNLKGVLIFEDDIVLSPRWKTSVDSFIRKLPSDWDMAYFGGKVILNKSLVDVGVYRPDYMYFTFSYMVREKAYQKCIDALLTKGHWADQLLGGLHPQLRVYTMFPRPVTQRPRQHDSDNLGNSPVPPVAISKALSVEGWHDEPELRWLHEQSKVHRHTLEIGTWKGRSTLALCTDHCGRHFSIDHYRGDAAPNNIHAAILAREGPRSALDSFRANLRPHMRSGTLTAINRPTSHPEIPSQVRRWLDGAPLDFAYIDGDHRGGAPAHDIALCKSLVKPGGIIAGHDYHETWPDVIAAVNSAFTTVHRGPGRIWWALNGMG